jgi:Zn-dependent peptidase ImmA (M78 family)
MSELEIVRNFIQEPNTQIVDLIRELGLNYNEIPLEDGTSGQIEFEDGQYTITIDANESPNRKRFTAAHELAHYLFHRDMLNDRGILNRHTDMLFGEASKGNSAYPFTPSHEVEANKIAAQLLMPKKVVEAQFSALSNDVGELAKTFQVSKAAMEIRLKTLGLTRARP